MELYLNDFELKHSIDMQELKLIDDWDYFRPNDLNPDPKNICALPLPAWAPFIPTNLHQTNHSQASSWMIRDLVHLFDGMDQINRTCYWRRY